jgi:hypothetical protein
MISVENSTANRVKATRPAAILIGCPMPSHKFRIGETVILRPSANRNVPGGVYEVTKQLPHNGHEFEYRIKSSNELHERVAQESELTRA